MTPRDHYAAAALQGLLAAETEHLRYQPEARALPAVFLTTEAARIADAMAVEACKRWGHIYEDYRESAPCVRCGELCIRRCKDCDHPKGCGPGSCQCVPF